jgi:hypothetical protein
MPFNHVNDTTRVAEFSSRFQGITSIVRKVGEKYIVSFRDDSCHSGQECTKTVEYENEIDAVEHAKRINAFDRFY